MSNKLIPYTESGCDIFRFFIKAQIIAKGTEHPTFHRVEIYDKVDILSLTPYLDRGIVCLLCKLSGGIIISIPAEWLQMEE
jgi:hypothetical protein